MRAALGLRLRLLFLLKLEDARVGLIGHFRKHQQIVATEALRTLPFRVVSVVYDANLTRSSGFWRRYTRGTPDPANVIKM